MSCVVKNVKPHHFIALNVLIKHLSVACQSLGCLLIIFNVMLAGVAFELICVYFATYIMSDFYNYIKWGLALLSLRIWLLHLCFLTMSPPMEAPVQRITRCWRLILGRVTLGAWTSKTKGWRTKQNPSSLSTTSPTLSFFRIPHQKVTYTSHSADVSVTHG